MTLRESFSRRRMEAAPAFIPYLMAGDPDIATTEALILSLDRCGAVAIELGIPYGDPLADGATIAAAGARALLRGIGIPEVLDLIARLTPRIKASIVLFTYFNPIDRYGLEKFATDAARVGASAAIVPDLALEESAELRAIFKRNALDMPLLVAPSTPPERAVRIAAASSGFLYVVSRLGVTGAGNAPDFALMRAQISSLRRSTQLPIAVGFGVSRNEHVRALADDVDAVIVGSALIDAYSGCSGEAAVRAVEAFVVKLMT